MSERGGRSVRGYVGVIGPGAGSTWRQQELAEEAGRLLAGEGAVVVTGGLDGVMAAASRGAAAAGGLTLGLLPGASRDGSSPHLTVSVPTGMGEMRNALLVRTCAALVAVGGSWGTLSEVALAVRTGVPVYAVEGWRVPGGDSSEPGLGTLSHAATVGEAVARAVGHLPAG